MVSATPSFFGSDPATHPLLGGAMLRPLGAFEDLGRALVHSLDDEQRQRAIISPVTPGDIVTGTWPYLEEGLPDPGASDLIRNAESFPEIVATTKDFLLARDRDHGVTAERKQALRWTRKPKGIASSDLRIGQREMLDALIDAYTQRIPRGSYPPNLERPCILRGREALNRDPPITTDSRHSGYLSSTTTRSATPTTFTLCGATQKQISDLSRSPSTTPTSTRQLPDLAMGLAGASSSITTRQLVASCTH